MMKSWKTTVLPPHAFETHPQKEQDGYITGTFDLYVLGHTVQRGDRFKANLGYLKDANRGYVRFKILYDRDPIESGDESLLLNEVKRHNGTLHEVDIDLSRFAGSSGALVLRVESEGSWSQDRAVWVDARIERGAPSPPPPHLDAYTATNRNPYTEKYIHANTHPHIDHDSNHDAYPSSFSHSISNAHLHLQSFQLYPIHPRPFPKAALPRVRKKTSLSQPSWIRHAPWTAWRSGSITNGRSPVPNPPVPSLVGHTRTDISSSMPSGMMH